MANQPTYPHDIVKPYVWWIERGKIAIAYHDVDDGRSGRLGEFISPLLGYDSKIVASTIAFVEGGSTDTITDSAGGFLEAGFAAGQSITVIGAANAANNTTYTIASVSANTITLTTTTDDVVAESAGNEITISSGDGVVVRLYCSKKAEVLDRDGGATNSSGKFTTSGLDDEPEYPEQFHEALVHYAIARGYELMPSKQALNMAQYFNIRYFEVVKKAKAFSDGGQVYGIKKAIVDGTMGII